MSLEIRLAEVEDVDAIRHLLADDKLGSTREDLSAEGLSKYLNAFHSIQNDPGNELFVTVLNGELVGTFQLTWIPYLSRGGNERCLIEAVRVASARRGHGIGEKMMQFAIKRARERGCLLAQLTTDLTRPAAHRFYERLGFEATHHGMKLRL
ncbi:MAG TPA: GNAT family N-acetyltransferase [Phycisphaerales bacterium]|nr:GNAT family N-acetyltransferase [Phycisphaerales bacterium]